MRSLPKLSEIPASARHHLMASVSGATAGDRSDGQQDRDDDRRKLVERAMIAHPDDVAAQKLFIQAAKEQRRNGLFLRRLSSAFLKAEKEAALDAYMEEANRLDVPLRQIQQVLGLTKRKAAYRLQLAREDVKAKAAGLPTRKERRLSEQAYHLEQIRLAVDAARMPDGTRRKSGKPKKRVPCS